MPGHCPHCGWTMLGRPIGGAQRQMADTGLVIMATAVAGACGYLAGSVPFGLVLTRLFGTVDVRSVGSGNIGATNVLRTGRKDLAAATLGLDAAKGAVGILIGVLLADAIAAPLAEGATRSLPAVAAGIGAFLGHCFPVWLGFKGGKGVATYLGVLATWSLIGFGIFAVTWLTVAAVRRISSLAALTGAVTAPLAMLVLGLFANGGNAGDPAPTALQHFATQPAALSGAMGAAVLSALIYWRHHANIARLLAGTEPRIGEKAK